MEQQEVDDIIRSHVIWSMGAGAVPIPVLDMLAVSLIQLDMIKQLCRAYDVSYSESSGKAMISALVGSGAARFGASLVKSIPVVGSLLGVVSMPILSGASTYALAHAVQWHFESGGDLFDIDMSKMREGYEEFFKKGKDVALELRNKQKKHGDSSARKETLRKLEELLELKEKGIITEEEYESQKKELLKKL